MERSIWRLALAYVTYTSYVSCVHMAPRINIPSRYPPLIPNIRGPPVSEGQEAADKEVQAVEVPAAAEEGEERQPSNSIGQHYLAQAISAITAANRQFAPKSVQENFSSNTENSRERRNGERESEREGERWNEATMIRKLPGQWKQMPGPAIVGPGTQYPIDFHPPLHALFFQSIIIPPHYHNYHCGVYISAGKVLYMPEAKKEDEEEGTEEPGGPTPKPAHGLLRLPASHQEPQETSGFGTEAMTCQELLALSGALSAALPTGQPALDSLFNSLSKGVLQPHFTWADTELALRPNTVRLLNIKN
ncbi:unnamed protein product [Nezara viridula]|uniref:Uncharacterized protein n=1 Tax=Nezara viridula TaxID=85310 RepID=A0A9P0E2K5_NEZVI|nr:unnamed protein product [Nezara viridula]